MIKEKWNDESGHSRFRNGIEFNVANSESFPQDRDGQIEALATVFNNTVRAATLLFFSREKGAKIYKTQYRVRFERVFGGTGIGEIHKKSAYEYPDQLFERGLLDKVIFKTMNGNANHVGWALTDLGLKYQTIAAFFIQFEQTHGYSLYPIFGGTAVNKKDSTRAPMNRMKVLRDLESGGKSIVQLANSTHIKAMTIERSIEALAQAGMISILTMDAKRHQNLPGYKVVDLERLKEFLTQTSETSAVAVRIVLSMVNSESPITSDAIIVRLQKGAVKIKRFYIKDLLYDLAAKGILSRDLSGLTPGQFSHIKLEEKGSKFLEDFVHPLFDALSSDEKFESMKNNFLYQVKDNLDNLGTDIGNRYAPYSLAQKRFGIMDMRIREAIRVNNAGLSIKELHRIVGLSESACQNHIARLIKQNLIELVTIESIQYYRLKSDEPEVSTAV